MLRFVLPRLFVVQIIEPANNSPEHLRFYNPRHFYNDSKSFSHTQERKQHGQRDNDYVCRRCERPTKLQVDSFSHARSKSPLPTLTFLGAEGVSVRISRSSSDELKYLTPGRDITKSFETGERRSPARDEDGWITDLLIDSRLEALRRLDLQGTVLKAANSLGNVGPSHQHTVESIREWIKQDQFVLCPFNFDDHWILVVFVPGPPARAYLLDSKREEPKEGRYASLMQCLMEGGIKEKYIIRPWKDRKSIQQDNFSCGIYTMWFIELLLSRKDRQLDKAGVKKWMEEIYLEVRNGDLKSKRQDLIKKLEEDLDRKKDMLKEREQRNEGKQEDDQEVNEMEGPNAEKAEKVVGVEPERDRVLNCLTKDNVEKMKIDRGFLSSKEIYIPSLRELKIAAERMDEILSQGVEDVKKTEFMTAATIFGSIDNTRDRIRHNQFTLENLEEMLKSFCQPSALAQVSDYVKQRTAIMILIFYIELRGEIDAAFTWPGHMLRQVNKKTQTLLFARAVVICYIAKDSRIDDKPRYIRHLFERQAVTKCLCDCKAILHLRGKSSKQGVHPIHVIWKTPMDKYLSMCKGIEGEKTDMWKQIKPRVSELNDMSQPEVVTQIVEKYVCGEKNKQQGLKQSKLSAEAIGEKGATHDDGVDDHSAGRFDLEEASQGVVNEEIIEEGIVGKEAEDSEILSLDEMKDVEGKKKEAVVDDDEEEEEEEEEEKEEKEEEDKERKKRRKRDDDGEEEDKKRKNRRKRDDEKEEKDKKSVHQRKDGKKRRTIKKSAASKRDQEMESEVEENLVERVSSLDEADEVIHLSPELRVEDTWKVKPEGKLFHSRMFDALTPKSGREEQDCEEEVLVKEMNDELKPLGLVLRGGAGTLRKITEARSSRKPDEKAAADFRKHHEDEDSLEYLEAYRIARELGITLIIHELYGGEHHTAILRGGEPNKKIFRVAHLRRARDGYYRVVEEGDVPMLEHAKKDYKEVSGEWLVENISDQQRPVLVENFPPSSAFSSKEDFLKLGKGERVDLGDTMTISLRKGDTLSKKEVPVHQAIDEIVNYANEGHYVIDISCSSLSLLGCVHEIDGHLKEPYRFNTKSDALNSNAIERIYLYISMGKAVTWFHVDADSTESMNVLYCSKDAHKTWYISMNVLYCSKDAHKTWYIVPTKYTPSLEAFHGSPIRKPDLTNPTPEDLIEWRIPHYVIEQKDRSAVYTPADCAHLVISEHPKEKKQPWFCSIATDLCLLRSLDRSVRKSMAADEFNRLMPEIYPSSDFHMIETAFRCLSDISAEINEKDDLTKTERRSLSSTWKRIRPLMLKAKDAEYFPLLETNSQCSRLSCGLYSWPIVWCHEEELWGMICDFCYQREPNREKSICRTALKSAPIAKSIKELDKMFKVLGYDISTSPATSE
ncbi:hypothetical protein PROFUN_13889 [Planoprotostelium fungivorum]|uniref:Ubiquitin-like protease family profile domain-containing protein n=1 Tax=Planoprotostelium fungivorum TaxID=1890364 RepID=A0A2P6N2B2_9EUKA|nr:hypothetical protein PROFUN_13889 [Planoprotostelium fungivorum]